MDKRLERILTLVTAVALPLVLILTSLEMTAFNRNFYAEQHAAYNIGEVVGTDDAELDRISGRIIEYLAGRADNLDMSADIRGERVEVFGEREKLHMEDVKKLFMAGFYLRNSLLALVLLSLYLLYVLGDKKMRKPGKAILASGFTVMAISIFLSVLILTDFQKYFIVFHEIFFDNDLWILNPKTDVLIQMLPLEFFNAISKRVLNVFLLQYGILMGLAYVLVKRSKKSGAQD